jgi:hypothetical protein
MNEEDRRRIVGAWLQELGDFRLDAGGRCYVEQVGQDLTALLEVPGDEPDFLLYTPICIGNSQDAALLRTALGLNLFQAATAGGAIAYDALTDNIVFGFRREIDGVDATGFRNILLNFLRIAGDLRATLQSEIAGASESGDDDDESAESLSGPTTWVRM